MKTEFDLPHALVTLTSAEGGGVEIEVWPKRGQSAFVVVDAGTAQAIAAAMVQIATEDPELPEASDEPAAPDNVVDLASRRRPR